MNEWKPIDGKVAEYVWSEDCASIKCLGCDCEYVLCGDVKKCECGRAYRNVSYVEYLSSDSTLLSPQAQDHIQKQVECASGEEVV